MSRMAKKQQILAKDGEKAVKTLLEEKGYRILETNYRTRHGEIDIIASMERTLVFVEVKTRSSISCGIPEEAVDYRKQRRIRKVAVEYLSKPGNERFLDLRFDVAAVTADPAGRVTGITILEGVF